MDTALAKERLSKTFNDVLDNLDLLSNEELDTFIFKSYVEFMEREKNGQDKRADKGQEA